MSRYKLEVMLSEELLARLDAARLHEPRASFARRAIEAAVAGGPFPVVTENLAETPAGEVVKADPEKPASYVQKRPPRETPEEPYELPKIAKRKW